MPGATAVRSRAKQGAWARWGLFVSVALHLGLAAFIYTARSPDILPPPVERFIPVFLVPRTIPPPPPPPKVTPREAGPPRKNPGGQSGQGMNKPALPVREPERPVEPPPSQIPPPRNPDPAATTLAPSTGTGEVRGDGASNSPGPGAGKGQGTGPGVGDGNGPGGKGRALDGWRPQWRRLPTPEESGRHYPKAARAAGIEGRVVLRCTVGVTGRVYNCVALRETPAGQGFGQAAVAMSQYLRISPKRVNGRAVAAELLVPLNLTLEGTGVVPLRPTETACRTAEACGP